VGDLVQYLTLAEVAQRLGVSEARTREVVRGSALEGIVRVGPGELKVPQPLVEVLRTRL
jgi:hypothetical protein